MFFESVHSTGQNFFKILNTKNDKGFSLHIHKAFECYAVTKGRAEVKIDGKKYELFKGEAVLVFPYQRHEYKTDLNTDVWVCLFSQDLVESYNRSSDYLPKNSKFLYSVDNLAEVKGLLMQKSLCYNICALFDNGREYEKKERIEADLILRLLNFVSENYMSECTLYLASKHVGYDYNYVSKIFKSTVKLSFNNYVNNIRIAQACKLLKTTNLPISAISEKCGYAYVRTFNREFLKIMKTTPKEYRDSKY